MTTQRAPRHGATWRVLADFAYARASWLLILFLLALFQPASSVLAAPAFAIAPTPAWVRPVRFDGNAQAPQSQVADGVEYLLSDIQVLIGNSDRTMFRHVVAKIANERGLESLGHVEVGFDPSYQSLALHSIKVHRPGRDPADKLVASAVKILQREKDLDYRIFDGTKTANVFLDDIRVGDVVEYAYSVSGRNPALANRDFGQFDLRWSVPVVQLYRRIVAPANRDLHLEYRNTKELPRIVDTDKGREYIWELASASALQIESDAPGWYDPYPSVQWSEFGSWEAVARWAEPLYTLPERAVLSVQKEVDRIARSTQDQGERMLAALRFVQGQVRYLGVEVGAGSFAPNPPQLVLERRFGDCKDKTLLTMALLRGLGIEARAALVHTNLQRGVADRAPSPGAFNHVIVRARVGDKDYWLDPTRSVQQGDLRTMSQANFGRALIVDPATRALTVIPDAASIPNKRVISVNFDMRAGYDKPARMTVTTVSSGASADSARNALASQSRDELQKNYLNFYARYYPKITVAQPLETSDDTRANQTTSIEHYWIEDAWRRSADKPRTEFTLHPADLYRLLDRPSQSIRTAPLLVPHPIDVELITAVDLPADWKIKPSLDQVSDPAFDFEQSLDVTPRRVTQTNRYRSRTDVVSAAGVERYSENLRKVNEVLGTRLFRNDKEVASAPGSKTSQLGAIPKILSGVLLLLWSWIAWVVYGYDPAPRVLPPARPKDRSDDLRPGIRGWLILAALFVIANPFYAISELSNLEDSFGRDKWNTLTSAGGASYHPLWAPLLTFELIVGIAQLVFSLLLAILFFGKRSSAPRLFVGVLIVSRAAYLSVALVLSFIPGALQNVSFTQVAVVALEVMAWIAYFARSRRVGVTFVERLTPSAPHIDSEASVATR